VTGSPEPSRKHLEESTADPIPIGHDEVVFEHVPGLAAFVALTRDTLWVLDVWIAGSVASGDFHQGVSDVDLVAMTAGRLDARQQQQVIDWHRNIDDGPAHGSNLGCVYVAEDDLDDLPARWPTWSHAQFFQRPLSLMTRAELIAVGTSLSGRTPATVLPPVAVTDAVRAELNGYWTYARRRPWLYASSTFCDLALISMARARVSLRTGQLVTKAQALQDVHAPPELVEQMRQRRSGAVARSPRPRHMWFAWADTVATTRDPHSG